MTRLETTSVLIVGAGPAGLTAAALLARRGIDVITVSRHPGTAPQPRATIMNQRTVEVCRDLGIEEDVRGFAVPLHQLGHNVMATSLAGEELFRYAAYGTENRLSDYLASSPCDNFNAPQHLFEPVLLESARGHGASVRFDNELMSIRQSAEGVEATVLDRHTQEEYVVRATYALGADGAHSRVAEQVGAEFDGQPAEIHMLNAWFESDLTKHTAFRPSVMYLVMQPGGDSWVGSGTFVAVTPWTEWLLSRQYDPALGEIDSSDEAVVAAVRSLAGEPDLEVKVKGTSVWQVRRMVAERYRYGRIFLVGDAAHRHPPAGGLGMNTSVQDSFNLAWKLAAVLGGKARDALLDSYDQERQPVGRHMVDRTMTNLGYMAAVSEALGMRAGQTAEEGWQALRELSSDSARGAERRGELFRAGSLQNYRSNALGTELGHRYVSDAIVDDGTPMPEPTRDPELYYEMTTNPGACLPHAWVEKDRQMISTLDLVGHGEFSLLVGIGAGPWIAAARRVADELDIDLPVFSIGYHCPYDDVVGDWTRLREVDDRGALLVRPDRHIAWRSMTVPESPEEALLKALRKVLGVGER